MKRILLFTIIIGLSTISSHAQLKYYSNGKLTFGNVSSSNYTTRFEGWGHYMSLGNHFLEVVLSNANPRIAGTGNQIVFYNTETSTYNTITVASVTVQSDRNAKKDIAPVTRALSTVMQLKPVTFDWKNPNQGIRDVKTGTVAKSIGFIAQDVETVLPELVFTDSVGHKLMNYTGIIPILTKSIQELTTQVNALKKEVALLKKIKDKKNANKQ